MEEHDLTEMTVNSDELVLDSLSLLHHYTVGDVFLLQLLIRVVHLLGLSSHLILEDGFFVLSTLKDFQ